MPKLGERAPATYTVSTADRIDVGTAKQVLANIKRNAHKDSAIRRMSLEKYAAVLVEDAPYFVPTRTLEFLNAKSYDSVYDRALEVLAAIPSSGTLILTRDESHDQ